REAKGGDLTGNVSSDPGWRRRARRILVRRGVGHGAATPRGVTGARSSSWGCRLVRWRVRWSRLGAPCCTLELPQLTGAGSRRTPQGPRRLVRPPETMVAGARLLGVSFGRVFDAGIVPQLGVHLVAQLLL